MREEREVREEREEREERGSCERRLIHVVIAFLGIVHGFERTGWLLLVTIWK